MIGLAANSFGEFPALPAPALEPCAGAVTAAAAERPAVERELHRCQQQLALIFDVTTQMSGRLDPELLQAALLRRYGAIVGARAIYLDRAGCCLRIESEDAWNEPPPQPDRVRGCLAEEIEATRRARRSHRPALRPDQRRTLGGAPVLLGALAPPDTEPAVIVAVRSPHAPAFDDTDVLTSEAVLAYGAQVLGHVVTLRHLQRTALETVCTLVNAIDAKDNYTSAHSERVGWLARLTGEALQFPRPRLLTMEWAGLLHDVGKIGVPEQLLNKPGTLTSVEFDLMKQHARIGYDVLRPVGQFEPVLDAVLHHHENFDGSGYPDGLRGDQIPLEARIIHIVDIFDALTTTRPYRPRFSLHQAEELLRTSAGDATDPELTHVFLEALQRARTTDPDGFRARFDHLAVPATPATTPGGHPQSEDAP